MFHQIQFCVFDIIYYEGEKVNLPLYERKQLLDRMVEDSHLIFKSKWLFGNASAYFELVREHCLEGIVQKKADSKYHINKRSSDWLKVINYHFAEAAVMGLRKDEFGLLIGIEENNKLRPAGVMEFISVKERKFFYSIYRDLIIGEDKNFVYLDPQLRCKIKFRNWTKSGNLRIPSLIQFID